MKKDLFIKYLHGTCTEREFELFLDWLKTDSRSIRGTAIIEEIWNDFEPEAGTGDREKYNRLLDKIHHRINIGEDPVRPLNKKISPKIKVISILTRVAAVLLLPVMLLLIYTNLSNKNQFAMNLDILEIEVPAGSRMNLVLGDGTKVWLNGNSKLKYPHQFMGNDREVKLSGEAYFEVAHNPKIPFIVETDYLSVKATGTAFNVNAYPDNKVVETSLVEGRVIVYGENNREIDVLSPNESLKFHIDRNSYEVEEGNIYRHIAWKDGLLVFKNESIDAIAKRLDHWFNVDVEISDPKVKELTYTATFSNESLIQVLDLMALATPLSFKLIPRHELPNGSFSKQKVIIGLKNNIHN